MLASFEKTTDHLVMAMVVVVCRRQRRVLTVRGRRQFAAALHGKVDEIVGVRSALPPAVARWRR